MRRYALALWFAMLALVGALRGWMAWRELPAGAALPAQDWLWFIGAVACGAVALWCGWVARRG